MDIRRSGAFCSRPLRLPPVRGLTICVLFVQADGNVLHEYVQRVKKDPGKYARMMYESKRGPERDFDPETEADKRAVNAVLDAYRDAEDVNAHPALVRERTLQLDVPRVARAQRNHALF